MFIVILHTNCKHQNMIYLFRNYVVTNRWEYDTA